MNDFLSIRQRALTVVINFAIFYVAFVVVTHQILPTSGLESLWFLSGIALWLFSLLSSPWFRPPRDTFANAVTAFILLVTADLAPIVPRQPSLEWLRLVGMLWAFIVGSASLLAMIRHDNSPLDAYGRLLNKLCNTAGRGEIVYSPPAMLGILGSFGTGSGTIASLTILWIVTVITRPVELAFTLVRQLQSDLVTAAESPQVGFIERIDHPNIIRVKLSKTKSWRPGVLHVVAMPDGGQQYLLALFTQVQGTEVVGTGICVAGVAAPIPSAIGCVHECLDQEKTKEFIEKLSGSRDAKIAGFTVERSSIGNIWFESAELLDLDEGDVVFTRIRSEQVFYQITEAEIAEETFDKNPRGTHIVRAVQLGKYSAAKGFQKYPWLPTMNTPVFQATNMSFPQTIISDRQFMIGYVPSTNIGVPVNIDDLISYHSAVLGVTGTGKTELALTIIREAISKGAKVFCVDFTGEYRQRLDDLDPTFPTLDNAVVQEFDSKLFAVDTGTYGAPAERKDLESFLKKVRQNATVTIGKFLGENNHALAILELTELSSSRANIRVTEIFLSAIMEWARQNRRARQVLLVLEEAHTIIPETFGSGFDANTQYVVHRIGQIALQGRKYGV